MSCAETQIYGAQLQQAQNDRTLFSQNAIGATANGAVNRTRVRARRGQATDPHSIAERVKLFPHPSYKYKHNNITSGVT
mgnify:CR=1 FL=1